MDEISHTLSELNKIAEETSKVIAMPVPKGMTTPSIELSDNFSKRQLEIARKRIELAGILVSKTKDSEEFEASRDFLGAYAETHAKQMEYLNKESEFLKDEDTYQQHLSESADVVYYEILEACDKESKCAQKASQKKPKQTKVIQHKPPITALKQGKTEVPSTHPVCTQQPLSVSDLRNKKAMKLHHQVPPFKIHYRVNRRWITKNLDQLRQIGPSYAELDDAELFLERAKHFFPGLEKLITKKEECAIYTFPTDRGFGMLCELDYNGVQKKGILYYGINNATPTIFHRYFVPDRLNASQRETLITDPSTVPETIESGDAWTEVSSHNFQFSDEGVISLTYTNETHSLRVFPLRRNLLDPRLFSVTS